VKRTPSATVAGSGQWYDAQLGFPHPLYHVAFANDEVAEIDLPAMRRRMAVLNGLDAGSWGPREKPSSEFTALILRRAGC
jgi:hypothetical protein